MNLLDKYRKMLPYENSCLNENLQQNAAKRREHTNRIALMKQQYGDLTLWLRGYDVTGDDILDGATWLYIKIQDAIEQMDRAMIAEDIKNFSMQLGEVKRLYLQACDEVKKCREES